MINNLKPLNQHVRYRRFRIESIYSLWSLPPQGCFLCSLDIKDAYLNVPIHSVHQALLRFPIRDREQVHHFQFIALSFGLASAKNLYKDYGGTSGGTNATWCGNYAIPGGFSGLGQVSHGSSGSLTGHGTSLRGIGFGWSTGKSRRSVQPNLFLFLGYLVDSTRQLLISPGAEIGRIQSEVLHLLSLEWYPAGTL